MKNLWCNNLHVLADATAMVFDVEQRLKKRNFKMVSEEEDDQRITLFDHVPRKIRSSVRYPQQNYENPNGASTSSTLLQHLRSFEPLDHNLAERETNKAPTNPNSQSSKSSCRIERTSRKRRAVDMPQRRIGSGKFKNVKVAPLVEDNNHSPARKNLWWKLHELADAAAMVFDVEQRLKKGKFKVVSEEEDDDQRIRLVDHVPRKIKSWVTYTQQNYGNPNGASTSSTLPHLPSFEPLDYNPNSQSSQNSCLTESTSHKRRAVEMPQREIGGGKFKKAKVAPFPPTAPRETPEWLVQVMRDRNGSQDPMLIFERSLSKSDVDSGQSRLLIPFNMLTRNDFLTPEESLVIEREECMKTILVNKWSNQWVLHLKRWKMKKESGNGTLNYALNRGWNAFVKDNGLKAKDEISLWTFRCCGDLCFALEHRPKSSI